MLLATVTMLACTAMAAPWHAEYGLTKEQQQESIEAGCFRGAYSGDMSLVTCDPGSNAALVGDVMEDSRLCVIELKDASFHASTKQLLIDYRVESPLEHVLFRDDTHIILRNPDDASLVSPMCDDRYFHEVANSVVYVPSTPILPQQPMPTHHRAVQRSLLLRNIAQPDPTIAALVNSYSQEDVVSDLNWVSTDRQNASDKITRNSYSTAVGRAGCADASWRCAFHVVDELIAEINTIMQNYPYDWEVQKVEFNPNMCSNVIVSITGELEPDEVVIIGAHLDSRNTGSGSSATGPAPGADDNGSGSAAMLAILRNMAKFPHAFHYSIDLQWYCGEEQGLLGSDHMARMYKSRGTTVIGMFNNDMIGYTAKEHGVTLSFMQRNSEAWLNQACKAFANIYVPDLAVGDTTGCCSDQQSWYAQGFPAAGIFETPTASVVYPEYHKPGDSFDNGLINMEQVWLFGQANYACILEFAIPLSE